jgi:Flp pilus assembly protein TadD
MTFATRFAPLFAAALGALAFLPALGAEFVNWDDEVSFLENPDYRGFGLTHLRWMFTTTLLGHWSPLTWMTWSLNYVMGGLDPFGYHLLSVLLHAVNIALFYLVACPLLARGTGSSPSSPAVVAGALFAALVFGAHPLRAESVAWVSGRRDVLCATFYLAATLAYLRGVAGGGSITARGWGLSVAAFAAAQLAKSSALTLPLTLLLLDIYPLRRRALGWRGLLVEKLPYALLAAGAAGMAIVVRQDSGSITDYGRYGVGARVALTGYTLWFYPWKTFWPSGLAANYELPAQVRLSEPRFVVALVAVVAITAILIRLRRRWPAGLTAWISSAIVLAPISGMVRSGEQLAADRYSYLSALGLAVLAGAVLTWSLQRGSMRSRAGAMVVAAAVVVTFVGGTWMQTATWRDSETLWRRAVGIEPTCSLCESNLGRAIAGTGRLEEAEGHVRRAIALRPDRPGPHENMGVILMAQQRYPEAEEQFRAVVTIRPAHAPSRNNLGVALATGGHDAEAESEFREAARLSPRLVDAPGNLGALYLRQQRYDDAIARLREALALDPTRAVVAQNLERALAARESRR